MTFRCLRRYINGLLDALDADGSGDIDRDEFQLLFAALIGRGIGDDTSETNNTDSPWFWMALRYKTKDADGAESEAMPVRVLQVHAACSAEPPSRRTDR